jgi:hypothetical protein
MIAQFLHSASVFFGAEDSAEMAQVLALKKIPTKSQPTRLPLEKMLNAGSLGVRCWMLGVEAWIFG